MVGYLWHWVKSLHVTGFLAVWGAILSSITFGWTLYRDVRDRAKVKITARLRGMGQRDGDGAWFAAAPHLNITQAGDELFIVVTVVNVGRRRMRWQGLGGTLKKAPDGRKGFTVSGRFLPKILEEQEGLDEWFALDEKFVNDNVKRLYIWDGVGGEWSASRSDLKKIVADAKKYAVKAS
jgi:hypothetical protein